MEKTIDVVVTSPPYNIGVRYNRYKDTLPRNDYLRFLSDVGGAIKKVLSDDGSFFINIGSRPSDPWIPLDAANVLRKYFTLQNVIVWIKSIAIPKSDVGKYPSIISNIAVGHFKPLVSDRYLNDCSEFIFHFTKNGNVKLDKLSIGVPYQEVADEVWHSRQVGRIEQDGSYVLELPFSREPELVMDLLRHGAGLEVGSKPELQAVLALTERTDHLIICNGYKDEEYKIGRAHV